MTKKSLTVRQVTTSESSNLKPTIFKSIDKKENGGIVCTRIYCFQSGKPILRSKYL